MRAQCKECGRAFTAASRAVRLCSDACRLEDKRRRSREYSRRHLADPLNRAIALARGRASIARRRDGDGAGGRRLRRQADRGPAAGPASRAAAPRSIDCRLCGRSFERRGSGYYAYCRQCRDKADREAAKAQRASCKECGKEFSTKTRLVRYCSDACRTAAARRAASKEGRRRRADPEQRAIIAARARAWTAARKDGGK